MTDYMKMLRAVIINDLFHDFTDLTNDETTENFQCES